MTVAVMSSLMEARSRAQQEFDGLGRVELIQEAQHELVRWLEARTDSQAILVYAPSLAVTMIMSPFASELYNYAWQELQDLLDQVASTAGVI